MGFNLKNERIHKMLTDDRMFKAYCDREWSLIGLLEKGKPKYLIYWQCK
ncbi:hypothetical protein SAMN04488072_10767 [Lentibacillus halodurans]|uniref:Uncharacterized protein n=1 Tax=Lentibacillus halodurans TaxID=237679 RepID=A0A1I0YF26_9BACI|nr:hypothetical protein SAMN04488072_10767 [Lentibacillus halodurans]